ncbi:MAG: DNA/RNA non-specific endonuclease [Pyrinomonadaceae bacterium]
MKRFYLILASFIVLAAVLGFGFQTKAQTEVIQSQEAILVSPNIVISQVFGGGGVASASPYKNDFIEIFNRSASPVNLNGWSVQFSYAGSSSWLITTLPDVTLAPGQYFLIQEAASANGSGAALPTPDATGTINMHPVDGKVALVNSTSPLTGACPTSNPTIVDFVGYGNGGCFEGSTTITGMDITKSAKRNGSGCFDTDQNSSDFTVAAPAPRNTSSATTQCGTITTPLSGSGSANPNVVAPGATVLLTVRVTPADTPPSTGITVTTDLSNIGGSANQTFYDNGTNGDATANDNTFSFSYTIPNDITGGTRNLSVTITDAQGRTANTIILLNINAPFAGDDPLILGNPSNATPNVANENNYLMFKPQYSLSYNRSKGEPNWVAWRLDSSWLGSAPRQDDFRPDPQLPADWYHVTSEDYSGSGYDRGHMTPSGDRTRSVPDNSATFLMTNIVPQLAANNQGPWEDFESYCRTLANQGNEIYIVSGGAGVAGTIAAGKVVVPKVTWKVALVLPNGNNDLQRVTKGTRTIAIIVPNQPPVNINALWREFKVSVNEVEILTGYDFFSNVPKNTQELLERRKDRD